MFLVVLTQGSSFADPESLQFACPIQGRAEIRHSDSVAPTGGFFDSRRRKGKHAALDLNGKEGDPVVAAQDGVVALSQNGWGDMGNTVILGHEGGTYSVYGHLQKLAVAQGATVRAGQVIGSVGYTGNAEALRAAGLPPHLHFMVILAGKGGIGNKPLPLTEMKKLGDAWFENADAELSGPIDPTMFLKDRCSCIAGPLTVNSPETEGCPRLL